MGARLTSNRYGKGEVRVSKIKRDGDRHHFVEASITVELEGDFADSYTDGDNRHVIATDSIRNTVYITARRHDWPSIEALGLTLARHFLETYPQVSHATVTLDEHRWHRIGDAPGAFTGSDGETPTAMVQLDRGATPAVTSGIDQLMIAKTKHSGFAGFVDDPYRTLKDTDDRVFATVLTADWLYTSAEVDFVQQREVIRAALLDKFARHRSDSVQQSLYLMGQAALDATDTIDAVNLTMPNKHHLKFNLEPFGLDNPNDVFHVTDEPYGWIQGTVERD